MNALDSILVTGAAGFIGSAVAGRLAALGHQVTGCDNFNAYYAPRLKHARVSALLEPAGVECLCTELSDAAQVEALFRTVQPSLVVHLAAQAGVRHSLDQPAAYVESNLVAFGHLLEACRRHRVRHLLYASSSSVYGESARAPFRESEPADRPVSLYAATKRANELMAHSYSHLYRLPATGMRLFTVYGPWGRPDMACFGFTARMLRGEPIALFGHGEPTRDFTYIDDAVEAIVRLLAKPPLEGEQAPHAVFNIGSGRPVRLAHFVQMLAQANGVEARIDPQPMQPGDVSATHADITRLLEWTGYRPATPIETGLARFVEWYRAWEQG
ncbi:MAG: NAD-dependent epimerase/dehydratase family protein [Gammaproteobacteria bacterium]